MKLGKNLIVATTIASHNIHDKLHNDPFHTTSSRVSQFQMGHCRVAPIESKIGHIRFLCFWAPEEKYVWVDFQFGWGA